MNKIFRVSVAHREAHSALWLSGAFLNQDKKKRGHYQRFNSKKMH